MSVQPGSSVREASTCFPFPSGPHRLSPTLPRGKGIGDFTVVSFEQDLT